MQKFKTIFLVILLALGISISAYAAGEIKSRKDITDELAKANLHLMTGEGYDDAYRILESLLGNAIDFFQGRGPGTLQAESVLIKDIEEKRDLALRKLRAEAGKLVARADEHRRTGNYNDAINSLEHGRSQIQGIDYFDKQDTYILLKLGEAYFLHTRPISDIYDDAVKSYLAVIEKAGHKPGSVDDVTLITTYTGLGNLERAYAEYFHHRAYSDRELGERGAINAEKANRHFAQASEYYQKAVEANWKEGSRKYAFPHEAAVAITNSRLLRGQDSQIYVEHVGRIGDIINPLSQNTSLTGGVSLLEHTRPFENMLRSMSFSIAKNGNRSRIVMLTQEAYLYYLMKNYLKALDLMSHAQRMAEASYDGSLYNHPDMLVFFELLGELHSRSGNTEEAIRTLKMVEDMPLPALPSTIDLTRRANITAAIGQLYAKQRQYDTAVANLHKAISAFEKMEKEVKYNSSRGAKEIYARAFVKVLILEGEALLAYTGQSKTSREKAIANHKKAIGLLKKYEVRGDSTNFEIANILFAKAQLHRELTQYARAYWDFARVIKLLGEKAAHSGVAKKRMDEIAEVQSIRQPMSYVGVKIMHSRGKVFSESE